MLLGYWPGQDMGTNRQLIGLALGLKMNQLAAYQFPVEPVLQ